MIADECVLCGATRPSWAGGSHYRMSVDGLVAACTLEESVVRKMDWATLYGPAYFASS